VVDPAQLAGAQQLRELGGVHTVALVPVPGRAAAIADHHARHPRREQVVQPLRLRAFLEGNVHRPAQAGEELQHRRLLGREDAARDDPAAGIADRSEHRCLVHVQTHILARALHQGRLLLRWTLASHPLTRRAGGVLSTCVRPLDKHRGSRR